MRKTTEISLKDAIAKFLKDYRLEEKLNETALIGSWEKVAGKLIARHTKEIFVKDRILYIKVDSPALRQELAFMQSKLLDKLNKAAGLEVITEIRFLQ